MSILLAILLDLLVMTYIFIICFAAFALAMYLMHLVLALIQSAQDNGGFVAGFVKRPIAALKDAHKAVVSARVYNVMSRV